MEFWHFLKYSRSIEKDWHLNVKHPKLKKYLHIPFIISGKILKKLGFEILVANSDVTIIKNKEI